MIMLNKVSFNSDISFYGKEGTIVMSLVLVDGRSVHLTLFVLASLLILVCLYIFMYFTNIGHEKLSMINWHFVLKVKQNKFKRGKKLYFMKYTHTKDLINIYTHILA